LLAELTATEVSLELPSDPLPALTANTVGTHAALAEELAETRRRGCSIPIARCTDKEVQRVAAIIRDHVQRLATLLRSEGIR
jgi:DNA-binding IclR family transcriptional regulator